MEMKYTFLRLKLGVTTLSDEQLKRRMAIRHTLLGSVLLFLAALGMLYFRYSTASDYNTYTAQKSQESTIQQQVDSLTAANNQLLATIEENGKELVSFTEDKIKYINLASELSLKHSVRINKLVVSDVWQEGEMSGMTTSIEVEGPLSDVRAFVESYCGTDYTNRINVVSCRPSGRYAWLSRTIDGEKVLSWFDLGEDIAMYQEQRDEEEALAKQQGQEFGIPVAATDTTTSTGGAPIYDPEAKVFKDPSTGLVIPQEVIDSTPITLDKMFADQPMKVYLVIDFLGRA